MAYEKTFSNQGNTQSQATAGRVEIAMPSFGSDALVKSSEGLADNLMKGIGMVNTAFQEKNKIKAAERINDADNAAKMEQQIQEQDWKIEQIDKANAELAEDNLAEAEMTGAFNKIDSDPTLNMDQKREKKEEWTIANKPITDRVKTKNPAVVNKWTVVSDEDRVNQYVIALDIEDRYLKQQANKDANGNLILQPGEREITLDEVNSAKNGANIGDKPILINQAMNRYEAARKQKEKDELTLQKDRLEVEGKGLDNMNKELTIVDKNIDISNKTANESTQHSTDYGTDKDPDKQGKYFVEKMSTQPQDPNVKNRLSGYKLPNNDGNYSKRNLDTFGASAKDPATMIGSEENTTAYLANFPLSGTPEDKARNIVRMKTGRDKLTQEDEADVKRYASAIRDPKSIKGKNVDNDPWLLTSANLGTLTKENPQGAAMLYRDGHDQAYIKGQSQYVQRKSKETMDTVGKSPRERLFTAEGGYNAAENGQRGVVYSLHPELYNQVGIKRPEDVKNMTPEQIVKLGDLAYEKFERMTDEVLASEGLSNLSPEDKEQFVDHCFNSGVGGLKSAVQTYKKNGGNAAEARKTYYNGIANGRNSVSGQKFSSNDIKSWNNRVDNITNANKIQKNMTSDEQPVNTNPSIKTNEPAQAPKGQTNQNVVPQMPTKAAEKPKTEAKKEEAKKESKPRTARLYNPDGSFSEVELPKSNSEKIGDELSSSGKFIAGIATLATRAIKKGTVEAKDAAVDTVGTVFNTPGEKYIEDSEKNHLGSYATMIQPKNSRYSNAKVFARDITKYRNEQNLEPALFELYYSGWKKQRDNEAWKGKNLLDYIKFQEGLRKKDNKK